MILENIKLLCKERKVSVTQLEKNLGLGNGTIWRWAKASPTIDNLKLVAEHFGVTVGYLLGESAYSEETLSFLSQYDELSNEKKELLKCYMSIVCSNN